MTKSRGPSRPINDPSPGYFLMRLVRHGPLVPAQICHAEGLWWAVVDGVAGTAHHDPAHAPNVFRIWHSGQFSDQATYEHRLSLKAWALKHQPDHPAAKPRERIDRLKTPLAF